MILLYVLFSLLFTFLPYLLILLGLFGVFKKANKPAWSVFVPVYGSLIFCDVASFSRAWTWLFLSPVLFIFFSVIFDTGYSGFGLQDMFVGIIITLLISLALFMAASNSLAKRFGKNIAFVFGLIFLPFIFFPILGFDKSIYLGHSDVPPAPDLPPLPTE